MLNEVRQWALVDVEFDEVLEVYTSEEEATSDDGIHFFNDVSPGSVKLMEVTITWNT